MRPSPAASVIHWLNEADSGVLYTSAVTIGEIEYGLSALPDGHRRSDLRRRFENFIARAFAHRVVAYDAPAARYYGTLMAERRAAGRPLAAPDGQIAAIARQHGMAVATRNVADFTDTGVDIINPWETGG